MGLPDYSPDDDSGRDKRDDWTPDYSPDDDSGRDKRDELPTLDGARMS